MDAPSRWRRTVVFSALYGIKGWCLRLYTEDASVYQVGTHVSNKSKPIVVRKVRADAERNRARLLDTAKAIFAEKGSAASLEEIAREAGVGIGTLYRHFPTRDALIETVYRNETEQLTAAAKRFAAKHPPVKALREWMLLFVDYLATKHGMAEALNSLVGGTSQLYAASGAQIKESIGTLIDRAAANGDVRVDIEPLDLLRAHAGVATPSSDPPGTSADKQLVVVMIAGISPR